MNDEPNHGTMEPMKTTIKAEAYIEGDTRKGKQWAKHVTGVDESRENGFAFEGEFLPKKGETQLAVGEIILSVGYEGSWKNGELHATVYRVTADGLEEIYEDWYKNFISLRDEVKKALTPAGKGEELGKVARFLQRKVNQSDLSSEEKAQIRGNIDEILQVLGEE